MKTSSKAMTTVPSEQLTRLKAAIDAGDFSQALLIATGLEHPPRGHPGGPNQPRGKITQAEFLAGQNEGYNPKRGRAAHKMDVELTTTSDTNQNIVEWTCPNCGSRNHQVWYGRNDHVCFSCQRAFNIKA